MNLCNQYEAGQMLFQCVELVFGFLYRSEVSKESLKLKPFHGCACVRSHYESLIASVSVRSQVSVGSR